VSRSKYGPSFLTFASAGRAMREGGTLSNRQSPVRGREQFFGE